MYAGPRFRLITQICIQRVKIEKKYHLVSLWRAVVLLYCTPSIVEYLWVTPTISAEAEQYGWITSNGPKKIILKSNKNLSKCYDIITAGNKFPFASMVVFKCLYRPYYGRAMATKIFKKLSFNLEYEKPVDKLPHSVCQNGGCIDTITEKNSKKCTFEVIQCNTDMWMNV